MMDHDQPLVPTIIFNDNGCHSREPLWGGDPKGLWGNSSRLDHQPRGEGYYPYIFEDEKYFHTPLDLLFLDDASWESDIHGSICVNPLFKN